MLVSHRKKFIYTKTLKTAGTSVEAFLEPWCIAPGGYVFSEYRESSESPAGIIGARGLQIDTSSWFNHMSAAEIRHRLDPAVWREYLKFCVVRNPYHKTVSFYHWQSRENPNAGPAGFKAWVRAGGADLLIDRDKYLIDDTIVMDDFVRYESLQNDLARLCRRLEIPFEAEQLRRLKPGPGVTDDQVFGLYYDAVSRAAIEVLFEFELDAFGYRSP